MNRLTLKDIAKELEVSISTVSKALKNSEEISLDTKEKIRAFAKYYHYRPNNIALNFRNKRTKNIGVFIPEIVHPFFSTVIKAIEKKCNNKGYNLIICVTNDSYNKEVKNVELLASGSIDGLIISISLETEAKKDFNHLKKIIEHGMPLVLIDCLIDEIVCDKVIIDYKNESAKDKSFKDGFIANYTSKSLAIIDKLGSEMGKIAAEMLLKKIEHKNDIYRTEIIESTIGYSKLFNNAKENSSP